MEAYYNGYINQLENWHNEIKQALLEMDEAGLDWSPGEGMNSITALVAHTAGAERYWFGDVAAGESSRRDRPAEFQAKEMGRSALIQKLDDALRYAEETLSRFNPDDLESERRVPHNGAMVSVAHALRHAMAHTALHLGHIQITRQLWELGLIRPSADKWE
jgi:uncharacterized damage-inducible protein DinB